MLYSIREAAERLNISNIKLYRAIKLGTVQKPSYRKGRQWSYTGSEFSTLNLENTKPHAMLGYWSTSDTARHLGVTLKVMKARIEMGHYPKASHQFGKRFYYRKEEILNTKLPELKYQNGTKVIREQIAKAGLYTIRTAAVQLNMPTVTLSNWIYTMKIKSPQRTYKNYKLRYFNEADLAEIVQEQACYFLERRAAPIQLN